MEKTLFYLKSKDNQCLYPSKKYPLTHSIDYQNVQEEFKNETGIFGILTGILFFLLFLIFFMSFIGYTYTPMHIYNVINGPKHINLQEFIEHVEDFKHGHQKFDYIQVELGENNIQISADHEIIRQYSNPETRRLYQHIATYKKLKNPRIYIKLPTRNIDQIHKKFEFDFSHFSIKTLKCITNILQMKSNKNIQQSFLEKADYVNFISSEYSKNSTSFNMLCLTKCGTLIGYLYKPLEEKEKAFVPTKEYSFSSNDIALETSKPYFSFATLFSSSLYILLILFGFYCILQYCIIRIKYCFATFPIIIKKSVKEKLQLLNFNLPMHEQLLKLDELISNTEHKFNDRLFIIEGGNGNNFIVILPVKRDKIKTYTKLPFMIYPVSIIQGISSQGIYYYDVEREREVCIKWPAAPLKEKRKYANWLHEKLMEISKTYRDVLDRDELERLTREEDIYFAQHHPYLVLAQNYPYWFDYLQSFTFDIPVPSRLIAKFRLRQARNPSLVNPEIENEKCPICQCNFILNETYAVWPCKSVQPHLFHYDCILEQFRNNDSCPLCRKPATFH